MEKEINIEKSCEDCEFFVQYYKKAKTSFRKAGYGHCKNKRKNNLFHITNKICESFKEKDDEKIEEEQLKTVAQLLTCIAKRISKLQDVFNKE